VEDGIAKRQRLDGEFRCEFTNANAPLSTVARRLVFDSTNGGTS
jgi:hypothetical protein